MDEYEHITAAGATHQYSNSAGNVLAGLQMSSLRELSPVMAGLILTQVKQIEKHSFPSSEAMKFERDALVKPNTSMLVLWRDDAAPLAVAYAVLVRRQRQLLLHKVCVHSSFRNMGIGSRLLSELVVRADKASVATITLWVDDERHIARKLYAKHGFLEVDRIENYYAAGRTGIKMSLQL